MIFLNAKSKKNFPIRILYLAKLSFRSEEYRKSSPDKQKLKEFITTKLALKEIIKGLL